MYLGIDIGTTATKAILIDASQSIVASRSITYPTSQPAPSLAEQDPDAWIHAVSAALRQLYGDAPAAYAAVGRIGLSGQMHSLVALDAASRPVRPAMLWNDTRGEAECRTLMRLVPDVAAISGAAAMPSFTAAKLMWVRAHEPETFARIHQVLLPKDYVRLRLTGELATDMSDAGGSQLFDQRRRAWSEPIVAAIGLAPNRLPPILEGPDVAGRLRREAAAALGLPPGIPVVAGGADAGTGAIGIGCVDDGHSFISLGTGATFVVVKASYESAHGGFLHDFAHCIPNRWYCMAAMLNGASCISWAARLVGAADIGELLAKVEERFAGPSRVIFLPYLSGERTPHNNAAVRGAFVGLDASVDATDAAQAVLEGVAFSLKDALLALGSTGQDIRNPGFIGGGSRSLLWSRIIASVLGRQILRYEGADLGPALGAARLAMLSEPGATFHAVAQAPKIATTVEPVAELAERYAERHADYQAFYPALAALRARGAVAAHVGRSSAT